MRSWTSIVAQYALVALVFGLNMERMLLHPEWTDPQSLIARWPWWVLALALVPIVLLPWSDREEPPGPTMEGH